MYWAIHIMNGLSFGLLLFLLAVGLSLVFGLGRIVNLAHGSFYLLGGYVGLSVVSASGSFALGVLVAAVSMAALGVGTERLLLQRFRARPLSQVLLTFGLIFVFGDLALWIWGGTPTLLPKPALLAGATRLGGLYYPTYRLFILALGVAVALCLWWVMTRTRLGVLIRAAVDDSEMASGVGIRIDFIMTLTFAVGVLLTGLAGIVGAPFLGLHPGLDIEVLLYAMAVVILGGLGSVKGTFLGALVVGLTDSVAKALWPEVGMFTLFTLMAVVLVVRPTGLFGIAPASGSHAVLTDLFVEPPRAGATAASGAMGRLLRARGKWLLVAGLALLALAAPALLPVYYLRLLTLALIWAVFAMSLDFLLGYGGIISLGHATFFGISAYAAGLVARHSGAGYLLQIGGALGATALAAAVLGWLLLRSRGVYFMMLTIAFSQVFWAIAHSWRSVTGGGDGLPGIDRPAWVGPLSHYYFLTLAVFAAVWALLRFLVASRLGMALVGLRESEKRMVSLGYPVTGIKLTTFTVSGLLGGVAGLLYVYFNGFVSPEYFSVPVSANAVIMIILGGAGTLVGPILGSFIVVFAQNILSALTGRWTLFLGILFVLVVLYAPTGLIGLWRRQWSKYRQRTSPSSK